MAGILNSVVGGHRAEHGSYCVFCYVDMMLKRDVHVSEKFVQNSEKQTLMQALILPFSTMFL